MSDKELFDLLKTITIGSEPIDVFYDHYVPTPEKPTCPPSFILYRNYETLTLKADDKVHYQNNKYIVDLILQVPNVNVEEQLETLFNNNYLPYDKEEDYIADERIYQIRYFI